MAQKALPGCGDGAFRERRYETLGYERQARNGTGGGSRYGSGAETGSYPVGRKNAGIPESRRSRKKTAPAAKKAFFHACDGRLWQARYVRGVRRAELYAAHRGALGGGRM